MESLEKRFGKLLAAHRRAAGLTQAELADLTKVSVDMVSKLETGAASPSFRTIGALANGLRIDPAELFTSEFLGGKLQRAALREITDQLAVLDDHHLRWLRPIIEAALRDKR